MKKLIRLVALMVFAIALVGCGNESIVGTWEHTYIQAFGDSISADGEIWEFREDGIHVRVDEIYETEDRAFRYTYWEETGRSIITLYFMEDREVFQLWNYSISGATLTLAMADENGEISLYPDGSPMIQNIFTRLD